MGACQSPVVDETHSSSSKDKGSGRERRSSPRHRKGRSKGRNSGAYRSSSTSTGSRKRSHSGRSDKKGIDHTGSSTSNHHHQDNKHNAGGSSSSSSYRNRTNSTDKKRNTEDGRRATKEARRRTSSKQHRPSDASSDPRRKSSSSEASNRNSASPRKSSRMKSPNNNSSRNNTPGRNQNSKSRSSITNIYDETSSAPAVPGRSKSGGVRGGGARHSRREKRKRHHKSVGRKNINRQVSLITDDVFSVITEQFDTQSVRTANSRDQRRTLRRRKRGMTEGDASQQSWRGGGAVAVGKGVRAGSAAAKLHLGAGRGAHLQNMSVRSQHDEQQEQQQQRVGRSASRGSGSGSGGRGAPAFVPPSPTHSNGGGIEGPAEMLKYEVLNDLGFALLRRDPASITSADMMEPCIEDAPEQGTPLESLRDALIVKVRLCSVQLKKWAGNTADEMTKVVKTRLLIELNEQMDALRDYGEDEDNKNSRGSHRSNRRAKPYSAKHLIGTLLSDAAVSEIMRMVRMHLFRSLDTGDEQADFEGLDIEVASWPHLEPVYGLLCRLVALAQDYEEVYRVMKPHIDDEFMGQCISLFASSDPDERFYVQTLLHGVYLLFGSMRSFIRKHIADMLKSVVDEDNANEYARTPRGIGELLDFQVRVIEGFATPVKEEHVKFLKRALLPLYAVRSWGAFRVELDNCIMAYCKKDASLCMTVLSGMLSLWPLVEMVFNPRTGEVTVQQQDSVIDILFRNKTLLETAVAVVTCAVSSKGKDGDRARKKFADVNTNLYKVVEAANIMRSSIRERATFKRHGKVTSFVVRDENPSGRSKTEAMVERAYSDPSEALASMRKRIGELLYEMAMILRAGPRQTDEDDEEAVRYLTEAAETYAHVPSYAALGKAYKYGIGMERGNVKRSLEWWSKGVDANDANCQFKLGSHWLKSNTNVRKGLRLLQDAAKQDHVKSVRMLGSHFVKLANYKEAVRWLRRGVLLRDDRCAFHLGSLYLSFRKEKGVTADAMAAAAYLSRLALEMPDAYAIFRDTLPLLPDMHPLESTAKQLKKGIDVSKPKTLVGQRFDTRFIPDHNETDTALLGGEVTMPVFELYPAVDRKPFAKLLSEEVMASAFGDCTSAGGRCIGLHTIGNERRKGAVIFVAVLIDEDGTTSGKLQGGGKDKRRGVAVAFGSSFEAAIKLLMPTLSDRLRIPLDLDGIGDMKRTLEWEKWVENLPTRTIV